MTAVTTIAILWKKIIDSLGSRDHSGWTGTCRLKRGHADTSVVAGDREWQYRYPALWRLSSARLNYARHVFLVNDALRTEKLQVTFPHQVMSFLAVSDRRETTCCFEQNSKPSCPTKSSSQRKIVVWRNDADLTTWQSKH